ncbi:MAG TPA: leucine-rich repeat domain-containing protein, partial [Chitinophagales bacterium]|nr:leucine-rich repeat domain-containing protein [Chitinophagales bacterium]
MKHTLLLILFTLLLSSTRAQYVTIPDANFVQYLTSTFPQCMNGNMLDTTCTDVINAQFVICDMRYISNLEGIGYFKNLKQLDCSHNSLTALPQLPQPLMHIDCSYNLLTTLPALPTGIEYLKADSNLLTTLPALPTALSNLTVNKNQLITLPALPTGTRIVFADNNQLTSLGILSDSLRLLSCSYNQLTALPTLPLLETLECSHNQFVTLPVLPSSLRRLYCSNNQLVALPALPDNLEEINCSNNQLTALPALPASLETCICAFNNLSALPALPAALIQLGCFENNITALPNLPNNLNILDCGYNPLTTLPALPVTLTHLAATHCQLTGMLPALSGHVSYVEVQFNQLTGITSLPPYLHSLYCDNNPGLTCLPKLDTLIYLFYSNTGITCLPNLPTYWYECNHIDCQMPICDMFNNNGCPLYWNLGGVAYAESNSNCLYDTVAEKGLPNIPINILQNGTFAERITTGARGAYAVDGNAPSVYAIVVDTVGLPLLPVCPANGTYTDTLTLTDSLRTARDFGFVCLTGYDIGVWSIVGEAHPARTTTIHIFAGDMANYYNASCATGVTGTVTVVINGPVSVVNGLHGNVQAQVNGNTLVWNAVDFGVADSFYYTANIVADTFGSIGQPVCVHTITTAGGDYNTANDTGMFCFNVTASYDPNDKQVYPQGNLDTTQKWLTYTVRFQNTGTAPAFNIHVDDTLDANLDAATFKLLGYSHQPQVFQKGRAVRFYFPNINLPDSNTNEPASHGYVQYKVKLKPNLPIGATISNTAFIYFDFNEPVIT